MGELVQSHLDGLEREVPHPGSALRHVTNGKKHQPFPASTSGLCVLSPTNYGPATRAASHRLPQPAEHLQRDQGGGGDEHGGDLPLARPHELAKADRGGRERVLAPPEAVALVPLEGQCRDHDLDDVEELPQGRGQLGEGEHEQAVVREEAARAPRRDQISVGGRAGLPAARLVQGNRARVAVHETGAEDLRRAAPRRVEGHQAENAVYQVQDEADSVHAKLRLVPCLGRDGQADEVRRRGPLG